MSNNKAKKLFTGTEAELLAEAKAAEDAQAALDAELESDDFGRMNTMRDPSIPLSSDAKKRYARQVMLNIREGLTFDAACWAASLDPAELNDWMSTDARVKLSVMRQLALTEKDLVRKVRAGGQGMSQAKAALEILERLFKGWSSKATTSLATGLKDALDEMERQLPTEHYETVLRIIARHSK